MINFQIYTNKHMQFREALEWLTNAQIKETGSVCNQTVMDLRDVCKFLSSKNDEIIHLERLAEQAEGIIASSNLPMPDENKIDILQECLKMISAGIKTYVAQIAGE